VRTPPPANLSLKMLSPFLDTFSIILKLNPQRTMKLLKYSKKVTCDFQQHGAAVVKKYPNVRWAASCPALWFGVRWTGGWMGARQKTD
jgi:hypothetical protein